MIISGIIIIGAIAAVASAVLEIFNRIALKRWIKDMDGMLEEPVVLHHEIKKK